MLVRCKSKHVLHGTEAIAHLDARRVFTLPKMNRWSLLGRSWHLYKVRLILVAYVPPLQFGCTLWHAIQLRRYHHLMRAHTQSLALLPPSTVTRLARHEVEANGEKHEAHLWMRSIHFGDRP